MATERTGPTWALSEDRTTLTASFRPEANGAMRLDADAVDEFIANLARMRAAMQPPIPLDADPDPGALMQVSPTGRWYAQELDNYPGLALGLLHPGHRWVWIALPWARVRELAGLLQRLLQRAPK